ncbi:hypothetical protein CSKR_110245 [Clonorchis sinensis]|uniref:Uncharacterized protein n=1 Tax=Clonorchis sinensis TaxID=79923 RepID=A0A8T1MUB0_CLOSI|nr:hypothetical protein CSKR_110245 [Clonorchis sinensis]
MGIRLSRTTASTSSKNLLTSIRVEPTTDGLDTEKSEFQRNDNATKLVEHGQTLLYSPIQVTASSLSSSSSSIHRPKLGQSPPYIRAYVEEADQYWFERQHVDRLKEEVARRKVIPRPPWKPPALKASCPSYQTLQSRITNPQKRMARKTQAYLDRTSRTSGFNGRRIASSSSLAVLHDTKLQNGEAHLRRCSAARQVQARKSDALDSLSMICVPTTTCHNSLEPSTRKRYCLTAAPVRSMDPSVYAFKVQQESTWNSTSAGNTCKIWSPEIHYPTPPVKISSHEETYPLRYVFYIEDKPHCVRAFANGKKVSMIARDTHCRVYFHAQYRRFVPFGQSPNLAEQNSVAEPTLYYQGKRVRPVTVAARNITELRRFLEILDVHYPEFGASAFLADQLILTDSAHDKTKHV